MIRFGSRFYGQLFGLRQNAQLLSLGLIEQGLITGSSFAFTAIVANALGASDFGIYSVAWSFLMLAETSLWGFFGDSLPSTLNKIPVSKAPEARGGLLALSLSASCILAAGFVLAAVVSLRWGNDWFALLVAAGAALIALRAQTMFRRICYLDFQRRPALVSAIVFSVSLVSGGLVLKFANLASPSSAMGVLSAASFLAFLPILRRPVPIKSPERRLLLWLAARLIHTGHWVSLSSALSWLGNLGVIPVTAMLAGLEASGVLRAVQTVVSPMSQANAVVSSVLVPRLAKANRERRPSSPWPAIVIYLIASVPYALTMSLAGTPLLTRLFGPDFAAAGGAVIAVATFGYAIESIRFGLNASMLADGRTRFLFISQCVALSTLAVILPYMSVQFGVLGVVLAMTIANNAGTLFTLTAFICGKSKVGARPYKSPHEKTEGL
ncbi:lipopolysaccharide biosynthesis protein [Brevundimonas sp. TWP2-3-4b1]|uniref:lipopolysaccharide biosynthesis protein n=1 Tax=Brevundimonas sp. TWP2-3-4b1 TaxID=2804580 RepID=UPI003CF7096C